RVTREGKTEAMNSATVQQVIDEVNTEMDGNGRILVRPSGTENLLRVMVEAQTDEEAYNYAKRIADQVSKEFGVE
ncbi:phosphoglucosamine mutase, partial [Aerococcus sp. L_4]